MTAVVNTVDISEFQSLSDDDWQAMKNAGIQTVIIRATSSLRLDKLVKIHIAAAKKFGFNWHLYHDWEGQTGEAEFAIKTAQELGLSSNQVLFYDMEDTHAGNWSAIFEDFRQKASSHFKVGLYISESPYQERFNDNQLQAEHVIRWIANYSKEPKNYDIWQKSGHGSGGFGSYPGDIDRDVDPNEILKVVIEDPVKDYKPTPEDIMLRQIILQPGFDSETGVYGLGCSYDNGKTFRVYWTIFGRKFYQEDADRLWPFLKNKITNAMSVDWDSIQNKPKFVTPDELETRLNKLSVPTIKWADVEDKPSILKQSDLDDVKVIAENALSNAKQAQSTADANSKKFDDYVTNADYQEEQSMFEDTVSTQYQQLSQDVDTATKAANQAQATADQNKQSLATKVDQAALKDYATKDDLKNVIPSVDVPQINSGDFDDLTENKTYEISSNSGYTHAPVSGKKGILVVHGGQECLVQVFYAVNDYVYRRMRYAGSWHEWKWNSDWN